MTRRWTRTGPWSGTGSCISPARDFEDLDDVLDNFFPQSSSQWDSLAHVAYSPGVFYNGATDDDVLTGQP